jgi:ABC-type branched-subunit amino acid transport system ATPase component
MAERAGGRAALKIDDLHVYYGESHAIQGVSLTLERGVLSVVGRNGMGKTTLCNTITGLMRPRSGSIRVDGSTGLALATCRKAGGSGQA